MTASTTRRRRLLATLTALGAAAALAALPVLPASASAAEITGVVRDSNGDRMAGVAVVVFKKTGSYWSEANTVFSLADGSFASGVDVGSYRLMFDPGPGVDAPEFNGGVSSFGKAPVIRTELSQSVTRNATLERGGVVTGVVKRPDGTPIAGASVESAGTVSYNLPSRTVVTDANGVYRFTGMPPAAVTLHVDAGSSSPQRYWGGAYFLADADSLTPKLGGKLSGRDVILPAAAAITGSLTREGAAIPAVAYAFISIKNADKQWETYTTSVILNGALSATGLPPRPTLVLFSPSDGNWGSEYYSDRVFEENATVLSLSPGVTTPNVNAFLELEDGTLTTGASLPSLVHVGETISAPVTGWPAGTEFRIQWTRNGADIPGATGSTLKIKPGYLGDSIGLSMQVANTGYMTIGYSESVSQPVAKGVISPVGAPSIVGTPELGSTLTAKPGTWMDGVELSYRWLRDGAPIAGETAKKYRITKKDTGHLLSVRVTATRTYYAKEVVYSSSVAIPAGAMIG